MGGEGGGGMMDKREREKKKCPGKMHVWGGGGEGKGNVFTLV